MASSDDVLSLAVDGVLALAVGSVLDVVADVVGSATGAMASVDLVLWHFAILYMCY